MIRSFLHTLPISPGAVRAGLECTINQPPEYLPYVYIYYSLYTVALFQQWSAEHEFVIHNNMCYRSGIMSKNEKTISFRAVAEKIEALDSLAAAQDRPRSYLINEAITNYIELHAYQDALVHKGLEEMRKNRVVSHEEVVRRLKRTGRAHQ